MISNDELKTKKYTSQDKIDLLGEIIPNLMKYAGESFVVFCDGIVLSDDKLLAKFAHDIVLMKQYGINVIVMHGGEEFISTFYKQHNIGLKPTDELVAKDMYSVQLVEMLLSGFVNKRVVAAINDAGGFAIGISGKDANLIEAKRFKSSKQIPNSNISQIVDHGYSGEPTMINPEVIFAFEETDFTLVISSVGRGENGETLHINPLTAAAALGAVIGVGNFAIVTNASKLVSALCNDKHEVDCESFMQLTKNVDPMNPEFSHLLNTAKYLLDKKVERLLFIDAAIPNSLLLTLFTDEKCGTLITNQIMSDI